MLQNNKYQEQIINKFPDIKIDTNQSNLLIDVESSKILDIAKFFKENNFRLLTILANDVSKEKNVFEIYYVFGLPIENIIIMIKTDIDLNKKFTSIMEVFYNARLYELEIRDMFGLEPIGNLDGYITDDNGEKQKRRLVHHHNWPESMYPLLKNFPMASRPVEANVPFPFRRATSEGVFEIPVGPIHAGVIEPGHFRFTAVGEMILDLKIRLYYTHKGIEKLFEAKNIDDAVLLSERVSGDTSFGHSLAFCEAVENAGKIEIPKRAKQLREIFLELERIYNHVGDIGIIGLDASFSFSGSNGTRLKELAMRLNSKLSGSRVLRDLNTVGGIKQDINDNQKQELESFLILFKQDFTEFVNILLSTASFLDRVETTAILHKQIASDYDNVGYVARASGLRKDARIDFPNKSLDDIKFNIPVLESGDVYARLMIRIEEIKASLGIISDILDNLSSGSVTVNSPINLPEGKIGISIIESWRGELVYVVITGPNNSLYRVKVRDASFINWPTISHAILNNIVPDFPICNKSYDMSYSGNDL